MNIAWWIQNEFWTLKPRSRNRLRTLFPVCDVINRLNHVTHVNSKYKIVNNLQMVWNKGKKSTHQTYYKHSRRKFTNSNLVLLMTKWLVNNHTYYIWECMGYYCVVYHVPECFVYQRVQSKDSCRLFMRIMCHHWVFFLEQILLRWP